MKKKLSIWLVASLLTITSFAVGTDSLIPSQIVSTFEKEFIDANEVSWTVDENYYQASFRMNGQYLLVYYNSDGKQIGLARNILSSQLPLNLTIELKRKYSDYWISELFELTTPSESGYYVTVNSAKEEIVLKANSSTWSVFKKITK